MVVVDNPQAVIDRLVNQTLPALRAYLGGTGEGAHGKVLSDDQARKHLEEFDAILEALIANPAADVEIPGAGSVSGTKHVPFAKAPGMPLSTEKADKAQAEKEAAERRRNP